MPQQIRKRKQNTVDYSSNNKIDKPLSRGMVYRELYLHLTCTPTITGANNVYANTLAGDDWAVIKRIQIIANGPGYATLRVSSCYALKRLTA